MLERIVKNLDKEIVLAIIDVGSHLISMDITELRNDKEPIIIKQVLEYTEMTHLIMPKATLCKGIIYSDEFELSICTDSYFKIFN